MNVPSACTLQSFIYCTLLVYYRAENNHIPEEKRVLLIIRFVLGLATVEGKL